MKYTYHRATDGTDDTFDIIDAQGDALVSVHFWDDGGDSSARAEAKARLIVDALNAYKP